MKRNLLFIFALMFMNICMAQSVKTYSVYDTNQSGDVTIADVTTEVDKVKTNVSAASSQQYVTADDLVTLISDLKSEISSLKSDMQLIKAKLGIEDEPGDTHEYVNLGLPSGTLWATCNIGAENPEDAGLYFAWGETTGYTSDISDGHSFDWANYSLCGGSETTMTKYCASSSYGTVDDKTELEAADDAATVNWGSKWCMPTKAQLTELTTECTWTWDADKKGYKVSSKSDATKYIFIPAAGYRIDSMLSSAGSYGCFWSRSLNSSYSSNAFVRGIDSGGVYGYGSNRCFGLSVRAVRSE